nr:putative ribonuclease H-like domain-containing protein [Tanacetum cinerariifolium]
VGISHETSVARSLHQNGVVERRNHTLIEAARTMLIYSQALLFLWAEAVATTYFDELTAMASEQSSSGPALNEMTPVTINVEEDIHDIEIAHMGNDPLFGVPVPEVTSAQSSSTVSPHTIVQPDHQIPQHNSKWIKDYLLDNIIGQLSRPVSTRLQLH